MYQKIMMRFLDYGYLISSEDERGTEAKHDIFVFSKMKEDSYYEASLYIANDQLLVCYDILEGEIEVIIIIWYIYNMKR